MNSKKYLGILSSLLFALPMAACGTVNPSDILPNNSDNTTITEELSDVDKKIHDIYDLAVKGGYEGTYEQWLKTIQGEAGVGIKDITASDVDADGNIIVTVTLTNGEVKEIKVNISNAIKPGKSAYELYVDNFGYVGSETDWLKDLANHELGTEKEYTIGVYRLEMDRYNSPKLLPVSAERTYKNGEKVNIIAPESEDGSALDYAIDNFENDDKSQWHHININDYRAHKNGKIVLVYSQVFYCFYNEKGEDIRGTQHEINKPFTVKLMKYLNEKFVEVDKSLVAQMDFIITHNMNSEANVTFNKETLQFNSDKPTDVTFEVSLNKKFITETSITFFDPNNEPIYTWPSKVEDIHINDIYEIRGTYKDEIGKPMDTDELFYQGELKYKIESTNNAVVAYNSYTIRADAVGSAKITVLDANNKILWSFTINVIANTPDPNPNPNPNPNPVPGETDFKLYIRGDKNKLFVNEPILVEIFLGPKNSLPLSKGDVTVNDKSTNLAATNIDIDKVNSTITFKQAGTYDISVTYSNKTVIETVTVVNRNQQESPIIENATYKQLTSAEYKNLGQKFNATLNVKSFLDDRSNKVNTPTAKGGLIVTADTTSEIHISHSSANATFQWNKDMGIYEIGESLDFTTNSLTSQIKLGSKLTAELVRKDYVSPKGANHIQFVAKIIKVEAPVIDNVPGEIENGFKLAGDQFGTSYAPRTFTVGGVTLQTKDIGFMNKTVQVKKNSGTIYNITPTTKPIDKIVVEYRDTSNFPRLKAMFGNANLQEGYYLNAVEGTLNGNIETFKCSQTVPLNFFRLFPASNMCAITSITVYYVA